MATLNPDGSYTLTKEEFDALTGAPEAKPPQRTWTVVEHDPMTGHRYEILHANTMEVDDVAKTVTLSDLKLAVPAPVPSSAAGALDVKASEVIANQRYAVTGHTTAVEQP